MTNIKIITKEYYDPFAHIFANAYPGIGVNTEDDIKRLKERLFEAEPDPRVANYGLIRDGALLGVMRIYDFQMNFFGHRILCGGIGSVAVDLAHKKQHVAMDLVRWYLDYYRDKGAPMAILWPFRPDFYHDMGFGLGAKIFQYNLNPSHLPASGLRTNVRHATLDDIDLIRACSDRAVDRTTGMIEETELMWRRRLEKFQPTKVAVFEAEGRIEGYIIYTFSKTSSDSFISNDIKVLELIYENRDALSGLLGYLQTQADQVTRIILNTTDAQFHFLTDDILDGSNNIVHQVYHQSGRIGVGIMYRILDIGKLFGVMDKRRFGGEDCCLRLNITDNLVSTNNGSFIITVENGVATLTPDARDEVEISLDIAELSSLIMGAVTFRKLFEYKRAEISDTDYVDRINAIFVTDQIPVSLADF